MQLSQSFAWLYWNPSRIAFNIPYFNHPVAWYGLLFVLGFILGYFIIYPIFIHFLEQINEPKHPQKNFSNRKQMAYFLTDRLSWFVIIGTIIGARLGDVLFYDGPYWENPIEIFKVWNGGLAGHGGVIGVLISLFIYLKYIQQWVSQLTYLRLLDFVAIPSALISCFIRLGNFINQEILGKVTHYPWAIIFGHPVDGSFPRPRHPVQLYEAAAYLTTFIILRIIWKRQHLHAYPGQIIGWMFVLIFSSRFILEFFKASQESFLNTPWLKAGQILSFPFILLGSYLIVQAKFPCLKFSCIKNI